ncbi:hypothetical protein BDR03DRAFT_990922 [Suillus americanus]|nr:hypothetical protein BDR03DRAFT_990922 [Suillus americanus]
MSIQPFISLYRYAVKPIVPLITWFGTKVYSLDLVAVFRLCIPNICEPLERIESHLQRRGPFSLPGILPSFMLSGLSPGLYITAQAIVEYIPVSCRLCHSAPSFLYRAIVDGFTRAMLLCDLIPLPVMISGWTATDIWSAPLITSLDALLTHAEPFWAELHGVISTALGGESVRALCVLILAVLLSTRTANNFGLIWKKSVAVKIKIQ